MYRYGFKATFKDRDDRRYCIETSKESYHDAYLKALSKVNEDVGATAPITSLTIVSYNPIETFRKVFSIDHLVDIDKWTYDGSLLIINESLSNDKVSIYDVKTEDDITCYFKKTIEYGELEKCDVYTIYFGRFKCCFSTKTNEWEVLIYDWDCYGYIDYSIGSKTCCTEAISDLLTSEYNLILKMRKVYSNSVMPEITRDMLR